MGGRKKEGGNDCPGQSGTGKHICKEGFNESTINELLTESDRQDKEKSDPRLPRRPREEFFRKLRHNTPAFVWECCDVADGINLIEYQNNRHACSGSQGPNRMRKSDAQGGPRQVMRRAAPQNDCDGRPLKCDCR